MVNISRAVEGGCRHLTGGSADSGDGLSNAAEQSPMQPITSRPGYDEADGRMDNVG